MQRSVAILSVLVMLGGVGVVGASAFKDACELVDMDAMPEPVPVLALDEEQLTLMASADDLLGSSNDTHACSGKIRPGVAAVFNNAWLCTLNWIYADSAGALYIGTAGHCLNFSCSSAMPPLNIRVSGVPGDIGDGAFSTGSCGVGNDFGLIRIDPAFYSYVDPTMCHWGGPNGLQKSAGPTQVLAHFGHGTFWGQDPLTQGRLGARPSYSASAIVFTGMVGPGDSGSPIRAIGPDNGAAGVITHTSSYAFPHTGSQYANRVDHGLARANAAQPGKAYHVVDGMMLDPDL